MRLNHPGLSLATTLRRPSPPHAVLLSGSVVLLRLWTRRTWEPWRGRSNEERRRPCPRRPPGPIRATSCTGCRQEQTKARKEEEHVEGVPNKGTRPFPPFPRWPSTARRTPGTGACVRAIVPHGRARARVAGLSPRGRGLPCHFGRLDARPAPVSRETRQPPPPRQAEAMIPWRESARPAACLARRHRGREDAPGCARRAVRWQTTRHGEGERAR